MMACSANGRTAAQRLKSRNSSLSLTIGLTLFSDWKFTINNTGGVCSAILRKTFVACARCSAMRSSIGWRVRVSGAGGLRRGGREGGRVGKRGGLGGGRVLLKKKEKGR